MLRWICWTEILLSRSLQHAFLFFFSLFVPFKSCIVEVLLSLVSRSLDFSRSRSQVKSQDRRETRGGSASTSCTILQSCQGDVENIAS